MCEGGLRRHAKRSHEALNDHRTNGTLNTLQTTARRRPKLGEGFLPSLKQHGARAPDPQSGSARRCAKPRHLGASSPSGNVRGECRGWTPLDRGQKIVECKRHNIEFVFSVFCPLRIPPKQKEEQMENSSPNPSMRESLY